MKIPSTVGFNGVTDLRPSASNGLHAVLSGEVLSSANPIGSVTDGYAAKPLGYAVTGRQQVAAYAVIDSLGRNLTEPMGLSVNLRA
jgi:hypothetical protein